MTAEKIVDLLKKKNLKISAAESCTGGLLAKTFTDISGVSDVFELGCVVYSNRMKHSLLKVNNETLDKYGAVSSQTAGELSRGICRLANSDIGVGITGIAGPTGGTLEKPVGLVYFSIYTKWDNKTYEQKLLLKGSRSEIRTQTVENVLIKLNEILN